MWFFWAEEKLSFLSIYVDLFALLAPLLWRAAKAKPKAVCFMKFIEKASFFDTSTEEKSIFHPSRGSKRKAGKEGVNFINILSSRYFGYNITKLKRNYRKLLEALSYEKRARKMLMKLTPWRFSKRKGGKEGGERTSKKFGWVLHKLFNSNTVKNCFSFLLFCVNCHHLSHNYILFLVFSITIILHFHKTKNLYNSRFKLTKQKTIWDPMPIHKNSKRCKIIHIIYYIHDYSISLPTWVRKTLTGVKNALAYQSRFTEEMMKICVLSLRVSQVSISSTFLHTNFLYERCFVSFF